MIGTLNNVLNTSEDLWLYNETFYKYTSTSESDYWYLRGCRCLHFTLENITETEYNFTVTRRNYRYDWPHTEYGMFKCDDNTTENNRIPQSMIVSTRPGEADILKWAYGLLTLEFTDSVTYNCSVFLFKLIHPDADPQTPQPRRAFPHHRV